MLQHYIGEVTNLVAAVAGASEEDTSGSFSEKARGVGSALVVLSGLTSLSSLNTPSNEAGTTSQERERRELSENGSEINDITILPPRANGEKLVKCAKLTAVEPRGHRSLALALASSQEITSRALRTSFIGR